MVEGIRFPSVTDEGTVLASSKIIRDVDENIVMSQDATGIAACLVAVCHELAAIRCSINAVEVELRRETGG